MIIDVSKLLLICGIKESFSCFKCSKLFVLSTILPLGLPIGKLDDDRVWQDQSVLVGPSILDILKLQEADIIFAFKIFIKSFASISRNNICFSLSSSLTLQNSNTETSL